MTYRRTLSACVLVGLAFLPIVVGAQITRRETLTREEAPNYFTLDTISSPEARNLGGMDGKAAGTHISPVALALPGVLFGALAAVIPAIPAVGIVYSGFKMLNPTFGDTYVGDRRPAPQNEYMSQYYISRAKSRGIRVLAASAVGTAIGTGIYLSRH